MPSSSFPFPSPSPPLKYDVFLNFRGDDTRNSFTSHLYAALDRNKIKTFIDSKLERGSEISQTLLKTIEESKISVVIFSKDYASSRWCLDELVKILECKRTNQQIVIPIFYHVDRSDAQRQTGCFADAFANHEEQFKDKVESWRAALKEVARIPGWPSQGPESELVDKIVGDICGKLNNRSSSVGIEERISWQTRMESFVNYNWPTISPFFFFFFSFCLSQLELIGWMIIMSAGINWLDDYNVSEQDDNQLEQDYKSTINFSLFHTLVFVLYEQDGNQSIDQMRAGRAGDLTLK